MPNSNNLSSENDSVDGEGRCNKDNNVGKDAHAKQIADSNVCDVNKHPKFRNSSREREARITKANRIKMRSIEANEIPTMRTNGHAAINSHSHAYT